MTDDIRGEWGLESAEIAQVWVDNPTGYIVENMRYFNSFQRDWSPAYANEDYIEGAILDVLTAKEQALDKERKLIMSKEQKKNLKRSPDGIKWDECPTYPP